MRPGQNKRMRGRNNNNNNRKGPNPLTRSYESNGPDVKIRGTAHHIAEKYLQLARDAQSSGDPVMAESYLQHAEHYFRLIAAAQQAQQQAAYGYQRPPGEPQEQEEDADDDFESLPDRFASPGERAPQPPAPQPYAERPSFNGGDRPPYEPRQNYDRQSQPQPHFDRPPDRQPQPDRPGYDRSQERSYDNRGGRGGQDRNGHERNGQERTDRGQGYQDRNSQGYQDRGSQDRGSQDRNSQDRNNPERGGQERGGQERGGQERGAQQGAQERPPRDYDNRGYRNNNRGPRDFREAPQPRETRQPQFDDQPNGGLPAFITAPTRTVTENAPSESQAEPEALPKDVAAEMGDETNLHLRPRRRRRPKSEFVAGEEGPRQEAGEPAGD